MTWNYTTFFNTVIMFLVMTYAAIRLNVPAQTGDMFFEESTQKHLDPNQCPLAGWNRHLILWMDQQLLLGDEFIRNWICWVEYDTFEKEIGHANTKSYCFSTCKPRCFNTSRPRYVSSTSCKRVRCCSFWYWFVICYLNKNIH